MPLTRWEAGVNDKSTQQSARPEPRAIGQSEEGSGGRTWNRCGGYTTRPESDPAGLSRINLASKRAGERSAGSSHALFDVAGTGNGLVRPPRQFRTLPGGKVSETPGGEATTRSFGTLQGGKTCACGGGWGSRASKTRLAIARKGGQRYADGRLRIEKRNSGLYSYRHATEPIQFCHSSPPLCSRAPPPVLLTKRRQPLRPAAAICRNP